MWNIIVAVAFLADELAAKERLQRAAEALDAATYQYRVAEENFEAVLREVTDADRVLTKIVAARREAEAAVKG